MSEIKNRVQTFAKKASSVTHTRQVAYVVKRSALVELDASIEPIIRQNERERTASMNAAARCKVGGK